MRINNYIAGGRADVVALRNPAGWCVKKIKK
jgi:hypothetical protein